jgi:hypothetical protein
MLTDNTTTRPRSDTLNAHKPARDPRDILCSIHPDIQVSNNDLTTTFHIPHMPVATAILLERGPGKLDWDRAHGAWTAVVSPGNIEAIAERLKRAGASFDTALIPPYKGRTGIDHIDPDAQRILTQSDSDNYIASNTTRNTIDSFHFELKAKLSKDELFELTSRLPGDPGEHERFKNMDIAKLDAASSLIVAAIAVRDTARAWEANINLQSQQGADHNRAQFEM